MKKLRNTVILFAALIAFGTTSCSEDETLQELLNNTELNKPLNTDGDGDKKPGGN